MDQIGSGGFGSMIGMPEIVVVLFILVMWVVPLAAGIWALLTLHRIKVTQDAVRASLESIERLLQKA